MPTQKIAIVMGSKSDKEVADKAAGILEEFGVSHDTHVISAHRNPNRIRIKFTS